MYVVGITGGICSGKSTVTSVLQSLGAQVLDADKLGHQTYEQGTQCYAKLVENFGDRIIGEEGKINRAVLGGIVFSDQSKMEELTGIVWPEIRELIKKELGQLESAGVKVVALEAAVMIEAGWQDLVSNLWVVTVEREVAKARLMARNNLSEEEALKRIDSQITNEERTRLANVVIQNGGDVEELKERVRTTYADVCKQVEQS
jgi:phosphopantetheine adenylyltransferase/dephospho-CoA kinase